MKMFDLKGKIALVTGAASGIGFGCAKVLLKNGVKGVALVDFNEENGQKVRGELCKEYGETSVIFIKADVTDEEQFEGAFEKAVETFKQLDLLINNAGIIQEIHWKKTIAVNLVAVVTGSMLAAEKYFPKYKSGPEAVIINVSSVAGLHPFEPMPVYSATKTGVVAFTRTYGGELRYKKNGVRIVAICPGTTDTALCFTNNTQLSEPYLAMFLDVVKATRHNQAKPEQMATNVMKLIKEAPTGSIWHAIGENCTQVDFPTLYTDEL